MAVKVNTMKMMLGGVCVLRATLIAFDSANWIIRYLGRPTDRATDRDRSSEYALIIRLPTSPSPAFPRARPPAPFLPS